MKTLCTKKRVSISIVLFATIINPSCAAPGAAYQDASLPVEKRLDDLLSRMTLEEKVAQMRMFHANLGIRFSDDDQLILSEDVQNRLAQGIAGIKNPGEHLTPERAALLNNQLQKYTIENSRLNIPALFVTESYNGVDAHGSTRFGRPINMAATWNVELTRSIWDAIGREARLRGMHMCHSPEADIVRDPRFGRMSEAFGEDTYLTTEMIVAAVTGVQGGYDGTGRNTTHIGAVTKHFAGYGQVLGGTNFAAIEISPRTLRDEIFPPFQAAVQRAHTLGIMASHGDINGVASHANPWLLTEVLRGEWGFQGYVVSDSNDIARLHSFMKVAETPEAAVKMAIKAGMNVDLYSDIAFSLLPKMAKQDARLMKYIDRSVSHVLRTKFILGLFDNPYIKLDEVKQGVRASSSLELAKRMDEESIILLKNKKKTLPLIKEKVGKVALLGPLLNDSTKAAFEAAAGSAVEFSAEKGFKLTNEVRGVPELTKNNEQAIENMVSMAQEADVAVLFLGGDEFTAKEAFFNGALGDRDSIDPVGQQDELMRQVKAVGKPVVVVLKHRRTLSISVIAEEADAILDCWDLSEFGDEVLAKMMFGEFSPSGKLPVTVPRSIGQLPFHYSQKEINYKKGYLFSKPGPLFAFGHGLSYTSFKYANLKLSDHELARDGKLVVSVDVSNTGEFAAKEVVQLYVKDLIGSVTRPDKELKGFRKIELKPGETRKVEFTITPDMLAFTGLDMKPVLEAGNYDVMVGTSSAEHQKASFRLKYCFR
ncbi:glycoside hydrolase family 3 N-terminal domain-containing protein [Bythopirellula polymerisocia]|uniref:Periplasmic beta-glucosidase n=1 Tax=Bythopirellula polymerisocia TaxID=2528003 RepID=A0A5C6CW83_9BACT|nr:glycoside hydrolase family 3 N-terminal domain-containing protein [Bythopirellula polymerisocia]TWU28658.1 Periplasmic beta-glucosidase precursor [Bythopirellula polymerisocia]